MRVLSEVVDQIKKEVPKDFVNKNQMFMELDSQSDSSKYAPPETQSMWWGEVMMTLGNYLGETDTDWKKKISDIIRDKVK